MKKSFNVIVMLIGLIIAFPAVAQNVPSKEVVSVDNLANYLTDTVRQKLNSDSEISTSLLAKYF